MGLSCGAKCAKAFLVSFNLIFWISGCFLFGVGVYLMVDKEKAALFRLFAGEASKFSLTQYLALALVGIGAVILVIGFLGCCGAIRENKCLLVTYFLFLFIIMVAELTVGVLSVVYQNKVIGEMEGLPKVLKKHYGITSATTQAIDYAQTKMKCCGIFGPHDYDDSEWKTQDLGKGANVAQTCCILYNKDYLNPDPVNGTLCQSPDEKENASYRHKEGCFQQLSAFIRKISKYLVAIGCGMAALQIFGMVFSICLCKEV